MTLTLGFSPCPNDTFIFDALVNGGIDTGDLRFDVRLEDVETLNRLAEDGALDVTKLSYASFLHQADRYALLHSGSALGRGVGPLLLALREVPEDELTDFLNDAHIAIPGVNTTANLLLTLAFPDARHKSELVFSEIEAAVKSRKFDAGLVIHESRFTYAERGLSKLLDLGDWWEKATGAAIPLGGIVVRRDLGSELAARVDGLLRQSIERAWQQYPELSPFVTTHAQEMQESVMRQHIGLYVNEYTTDLGETGRGAIRTLFQKAAAAGLLKSDFGADRIFY
jgi:1,4-dihydroxy-6-naphthoate synthase